MADVNDVLAANRAAVLDLVAAAERSAATWTTPRAPGKWSPSQVVEHVAGGLEEAANIVSGAPSIPMPPAFLRPLLRLYFNRILKKGVFPKGWKAAKAAIGSTPKESFDESRRRPSFGALGVSRHFGSVNAGPRSAAARRRFVI